LVIVSSTPKQKPYVTVRIQALMLEAPTLSTMPGLLFCFAPEDSSSLKLPSGRSRPVRQKTPPAMCSASGTRKQRRHERSSSSVAAMKPWKMKTMTKLVMPPPRLPHPPAVALARPTIFFENCCVHHTWHATNEARPHPMKRRHAMKPAALLMNIMPTMKGHVMKRTKARPLRAPMTSHTVPMISRAKMVPATEEMLPA